MPVTLGRPGKRLRRFLRVRDFQQAQPEKLRFGRQQWTYGSILPVDNPTRSILAGTCL